LGARSLDKLPLKERPTWVPRVRAIWQADDEKAARRLAASVVHDLREAGYDRAADCLEDDLDRCLTFFQFPAAHRIHLRTTNPIASVFSPVRLRTNAVKRFKKTRSGVCLMHQVTARLSKRWRRLQSAGRCPQRIYDAPVAEMSEIAEPVQFPALLQGLAARTGKELPDYLIRLCIRFWMGVKPALVEKIRTRYRPIRRSTFARDARRAWRQLADAGND